MRGRPGPLAPGIGDVPWLLWLGDEGEDEDDDEGDDDGRDRWEDDEGEDAEGGGLACDFNSLRFVVLLLVPV